MYKIEKLSNPDNIDEILKIFSLTREAIIILPIGKKLMKTFYNLGTKCTHVCIIARINLAEAKIIIKEKEGALQDGIGKDKTQYIIINLIKKQILEGSLEEISLEFLRSAKAAKLDEANGYSNANPWIEVKPENQYLIQQSNRDEKIKIQNWLERKTRKLISVLRNKVFR
jgi:hypothetical protein